MVTTFLQPHILTVLSTLSHFTVALLIDTSNILASSHDGSPPIILATTVNKFNVPWIPTTIRLHHQTTEHSWLKLLNDELLVVSSWKAVGHTSSMSPKPRHVFSSQYFVTKSSGDGRFQIHWKRSNKKK